MDVDINREAEETNNSVADSSASNGTVLNKAIFWIVALITFLLPLFFIPAIPLPVVVSKYALFAILVSIGIVLWSIDAIKTGEITYSKSPLFLTLGLLALISLASSFLAPTFGVSFFGIGSEFDTTLSILFFTFFSFLVSVSARSKKRILLVILALLASSAILALYQVVRLFVDSQALSFGLFFLPSITPVGAWYSFALFTGLGAIVSLAVLDILKLNKVIRIVSIIFLVLFLAFLGLVNFSVAWILMGLSALAIFAYESSERLKSRAGKVGEKINAISIPYASLAVFVVSVFFLIAGGALSSFAGSYLNIDYLESRPSWNSTLDVFEDSLDENPILGMGPNRFKQAWDKYRPVEVNQTIFWNSDYNAGVGYIPTFASTHGILGILAWLGIIGSLLYLVIRVMVSSKNILTRFLFITTAISLIYLIVASIFYVPSYTLIALMFMLFGLMLAMADVDGAVPMERIVFVEKVNVAFVSIFGLALVLILGAWMGYVSTSQVVANGYFRSGLVSANSQDGGFQEGLNKIGRAVSIFESDLYYRGLTEMSIRQLNSNLSGASRENAQAMLQNGLSQVVGFSRAAINYDERNVDNWLSLASVYEYMIPFQVEGAADTSRENYEQARERDPVTPVIDLALARVAIQEEDREQAREHLSDALEKKPDYTQALLLLSEMSLGEGNTNEALNTMTLAALSSPQNADIYLRMGTLLYESERYQEAVPVLERAVLINPYYANAKYFLALAYYESGRVEDAQAQLEDVAQLNPDNSLVQDMLDNLEAGNSPLEGLQ